MKERFNIIASSLSSYFGVGFNTPQEQLDIDLGLVQKDFDDDAKARMMLGRHLEDSAMNYFEEKMTIIIDERNSETRYACDGLLKCKRDGRTFLDGVETGWENKISNSTSGCFINDKGYEFQCQAYMMAFGLDQWVLAGLYCGKPVYKLILKNEEMQKDIEEMVQCVYTILSGLGTIDDFPWHLVEKYSKAVQLKEIKGEDIEEYDKELLERLATLKQEKKALDDEITQLENYAKDNYSDTKFSCDSFSCTISTGYRKGGIDEMTLSIEHPEIDLENYRKEGSSYKTIRVTKK